jgi:arginase family enzyme
MLERRGDNNHFKATGTAEPGGWTSRELLTILDALSGMDVIGADVGKSYGF